MKFVLIPPGKFVMGGEIKFAYPFHTTTIKMPFYLQTTQVTQRQWESITDNNPSISKGYDYPVTNINWDQVMAFIEALNALEEMENSCRYRLPSEAEWEYAARSGGKKQNYAGGDDINEVGWCYGNQTGGAKKVALKEPNGFGLYDMSGNVYELLEDDWHFNYNGAPIDGSAWIDNPRSNERVMRGGGFWSEAIDCRTDVRSRIKHDDIRWDIGFRLAKSVSRIC